MPASQLKRLKASLREHGLTGPQRSKKKTKPRPGSTNGANGNTTNDAAAATKTRAHRAAALEGIRDAFNPFEVKRAARPRKHDVTTTWNRGLKDGTGVLGRPGVTRSAGEEARRRTLLREVQSRHKVGGIVDRRLGEQDPDMTAEDRAAARFARERMGGGKKRGGFDLEEDDDEEPLTHGGRALQLEGAAEVDDFDAGSLAGSDADDDDLSGKKRRLLADDAVVDADELEQPPRKKSKAETIKEIVMKDKLRKYETHMAKEADQDMREELDEGIGDLQAALASFSRKAAKKQTVPPATNGDAGADHMNSARAALIGLSDRDYEKKVREIAQSQRSRPSERTKTDEEKTREEADRLQELEEKRLRRMRGEEEESDIEVSEHEEADGHGFDGLEQLPDDAADFGFKTAHIMERPPGFEDEDEFLVDGDLIASGSEADEEVVSMSGDDSSDSDESDLPDELLALQGQGGEDTLGDGKIEKDTKSANLAFTYECPRSLDELVVLMKAVPVEQIPEVVRRIRVCHDPSIRSDNKEKLADLAQALVKYIAVLPAATPSTPLSVTEQVIRHLHSMARTFPDQISMAFKEHLQNMHQEHRMSAGDLTILTAIGTIYPTSDHFHQVVTPAVTIIARWLGLTTPQTAHDLRTGAYLVALALSYQSLSKRYMPEAVRFTTLALKCTQHARPLLEPHIANLRTMASLWSTQPAFPEIFAPAAVTALHALHATKALQQTTLLIEASRARRLPLALHSHKPKALRGALPKFEERFDPRKHYDPDAERAAGARLRKAFKRERKGAVRELRKDASFLARERLRDTRARDKAYDDKYRRLVASIQGEEGAERNKYEREKRARKGKR